MGVVLGLIIIILLVVCVLIYNGVVSAKNKCEESKSGIDTVLQNRYDLIPNLVEVVKQYMSYEKSVLEDVTNLRSAAMNTQGLGQEKIGKEDQISTALKSIFALAENYPDLKANQNFIQLQNQWSEIEDRLQASRRGYNAAVKGLNDKKEMFPSSVFANMIKIPSYEMFTISDEKARENLDAKKLF